MKQYKILEEKLRRNKNDIDIKIKILRQIRKIPLNEPKRVFFCAKTFVDSGRRKVSEVEYWEIIEQMLKSCLLIREIETAKKCHKIIKKQFGNKSVRVMLLRALIHEAENEIDDANDIYEDVLEKNPLNIVVLKRLVAIEKGKGNTLKAIEKINEILKLYMNDVESYLELCDLYLEINEYEKALYCIDECILMNPRNYFFFLRYAEICYTMGDAMQAKKYYAKSLELNKNCVRALNGLLLSATKDVKLLEYAKKRLKELNVNK